MMWNGTFLTEVLIGKDLFKIAPWKRVDAPRGRVKWMLIEVTGLLKVANIPINEPITGVCM